MTIERAKELSPIFQAFINGEEIQVRENGDWMNARQPTWKDGCEYRVKPKKRPMSRGEILYMVTTTPAMVVRVNGSNDIIVPANGCVFSYSEKTLEYAIIDKHGDPIDGWHKFEIAE